MVDQRPFTISTTPRQLDSSSSLRSIKFAKGGNQDSSVLRRERVRGFEGQNVCVSAVIAAGGSTQSSSSSTGRGETCDDSLTTVVATSPRGNGAGGGNTNDDARVRPVCGGGGGGGNTSTASSSTSASVSSSPSSSSSSSSLMLMKFCWRVLRGMRPGERERPSRHARALERSALRLQAVRIEVEFDVNERNDPCR